MWEFLQQLSFWDWLALGTVLLILEVFGAGGYLLWIGLAAAAVGVLTFLMPELSWEGSLWMQLLAVLVLTLGLWDTLVIAFFVLICAVIGQIRDGENGIVNFFGRLFSGR